MKNYIMVSGNKKDSNAKIQGFPKTRYTQGEIYLLDYYSNNTIMKKMGEMFS